MAEMLKDLLDWDSIMQKPRYAGGHVEVMECLFIGAEVLASWIESDYQGDEAFLYKLADGRFVVVCDSFGSCSGCDSWEDASNQDARNMCIGLANDAHAFDTLEQAKSFCENVTSDGAFYHDRAALNLVNDIERLIAERAKEKP